MSDGEPKITVIAKGDTNRLTNKTTLGNDMTFNSDTVKRKVDAAHAEEKAMDLMMSLWSSKATFQEVKSLNLIGYSSAYLLEMQNMKTLSTEAELETLIEFANYDIALGVTIPELIYTCCYYSPVKKFIVALLSLVDCKNTTQTVYEVLDYKVDEGHNCLMAAFNTLIKYKNETENLPDSIHQLMRGAEETVLYLVLIGYDNGIDMDSVLNMPAKNGETLFNNAAAFSEKVATFLLSMNVQVNSIDSFFQTPQFRVSHSQSKSF